MLESLLLRDFKSFANETVHLSPVTVLVGANASGKSNLLDAIKLLHGVGLDLSLTDIIRGRSDGGRTTWSGVRGGAKSLPRHGASSLGIVSTWVLSGERITHNIGCDIDPFPQLALEALNTDRLSGDYLFNTHAPALRERAGRDAGGGIRVSLKRQGRGNSPTQTHSATRSLLGQIGLSTPVHPEIARVRNTLLDSMRSALFLDITPSRMRDYVPDNLRELGAEGENISAILARVCEDNDRKADLVDWLSELCAPSLTDIEFSRTDLGDVMFVLVEKDGARIPARGVSDGTLRFLGELVALQTASEGAMVLIEEIENGLHPTRTHLLVEAMESAARTRGIQVIATTHSPQVIQALSPVTLGNAIVMGRVPDEPGTLARRLKDLPHFDEIAERRGVDHLFTTGWMERAL